VSHADPPLAARSGHTVAAPRDRRAALGRLGEDVAAAHLRRLGFEVLERNVRTRDGEIDLIAWDGSTLVFAEVKTRRVAPGGRAGQEPLLALGWRQRARLRRLARAWLARPGRARPRAAAIRFDAIGVTVDARGTPGPVQHLEGAW
jgi:putative endonuclease